MRIELYKNAEVPGHVELKQHMGEDIKTQVNAARASFGIEIEAVSDRDRKLFKTCARDKHTSTMEHNVFTFAFKVPLFVARQHMRHRTWSFNEISRRYTSKDLDFYSPKSFRKQAESNRQASVPDSAHNPVLETIQGSMMSYSLTATEGVKSHVQAAQKLYKQMLDSGICREQARMVLPQSLYTYYWGTVNLNNFFKFYELRTHPGAQAEIQEMAIACMALLKEIIPETIKIYKEAQDEREANLIKNKFKNIPKEILNKYFLES
jgi:thymidylate synthase (FAD)